MGPFPLALGQMKYLIVGADYFTKWVKAKPLASIIKRQVWEFCLKEYNNLIWGFLGIGHQ